VGNVLRRPSAIGLEPGDAVTVDVVEFSAYPANTNRLIPACIPSHDRFYWGAYRFFGEWIEAAQ